MSQSVSCHAYYGEYHGHRVSHLTTILEAVGQDRPRVWLAGDSSLDSKFYQPHRCAHPAINGYERVLTPALCRRDVCYWLNQELGPRRFVVNCAVEESSLGDRKNKLLPQDAFIRDSIAENDILVVSVGGNDVALKPTLGTALNMMIGLLFNSESSIQRNPSRAWGMPHFIRLFRDDTRHYVERLVSIRKPSLVIVCMIYFPDENFAVQSWASQVLRLLGYNRNPAKLQAFIRGAFECATSKVSIPGVQSEACPLYSVLDGKDSSMYEARVEPSEAGGSAMAKLISSFIPR